MNMEEVLAFLQSVSWLGSRPGLERITELLARLGNPEKELKYVHVAGTNGKGSTCAMLSSILAEAGYKTGLYISPHLVRYNERMTINGAEITDEALCAVAQQVKTCVDAMDDKPTEFELVTAMALLYFKEQRCDIVVLETGLGGRLDATNVIPAPEAAVITNLGLEHTEILGDTIEKIAAEKGGIIKSGCTAVSYASAPEALAVLYEICREKNVPLTRTEFSRVRPISQSLEGQQFCWRDMKGLFLPLLGAHQLRNAAVALEAVTDLRYRGWAVTDEHIRRGLANTRWPARFEVLAHEPLTILDGGHNPQCVRALADALAAHLDGQKVTFLMGVLADKDYETMISMVTPFARRFVCVTPDSGRAMPAEQLAELLTQRGFEATACGDIPEGIQTALSYDDCPIVAFGSLYMAGAIRDSFGPIHRKWLRKKKIRARDSLTREEREKLSEQLVQNLMATPEFREAKTVLIYRATRGEVRLEALEAAPESRDKRLLFPLCISDTEMVALLPHGEDSWVEGYYGIWEPLQEKSELIQPEDIDLVVCPCTSFDEECNRMGMGAGFYDRYLEKCVNAKVLSVAFECQKAVRIPTAPWDKPMGKTVTEKKAYCTGK